MDESKPRLDVRLTLLDNYSLEPLDSTDDGYGEITVACVSEQVTALLLPMVFFDQGSDTIPDRYRCFSSAAESLDFSETSPAVGKGERETYYHILNILGNRLRRSTDITLELQGGWSFEPGETDLLAARRAMRIRDYLIDVWGVDSSRLILLPPRQHIQRGASSFAQEEDRAVLMSSTSPELFRPLNYTAVYPYQQTIDVDATIEVQRERATVEQIELNIYAADSLVGRGSLQESGNEVYHLHGIWSPNCDLAEMKDGFTVEALIHRKDGTIERILSQHRPICIDTTERYASYPYRTGQPDILIPFFRAGQTADFSREQLRAAELLLVQLIDTTAIKSTRYWVEIIGMSDLSDLTDLLPPTIDSLRQIYRDEWEEWKRRLDEAGSSKCQPVYLYGSRDLAGWDTLRTYEQWDVAAYGRWAMRIREQRTRVDSAYMFRVDSTMRHRLNELDLVREQNLERLMRPLLSDSPELSLKLQHDPATLPAVPEREEYHRAHDFLPLTNLPEDRLYGRGVGYTISWQEMGPGRSH